MQTTFRNIEDIELPNGDFVEAGSLWKKEDDTMKLVDEDRYVEQAYDKEKFTVDKKNLIEIFTYCEENENKSFTGEMNNLEAHRLKYLLAEKLDSPKDCQSNFLHVNMVLDDTRTFDLMTRGKVLNFLRKNGANCDCEVMFNLDPNNL